MLPVSVNIVLQGQTGSAFFIALFQPSDKGSNSPGLFLLHSGVMKSTLVSVLDITED